MENQNLIQEKNIKFLVIWNYSNSQTLNLKYKYGSRKNQVLQEKLQPSKKTVLRTKLKKNFLEKKQMYKTAEKTDTTKEDYQELCNELQFDKFKLF